MKHCENQQFIWLTEANQPEQLLTAVHNFYINSHYYFFKIHNFQYTIQNYLRNLENTVC